MLILKKRQTKKKQQCCQNRRNNSQILATNKLGKKVIGTIKREKTNKNLKKWNFLIETKNSTVFSVFKIFTFSVDSDLCYFVVSFAVVLRRNR